MKISVARFFIPLTLLTMSTALADDIVTLSGKKYYDVHDVLIRDNLLTFTTATDIVRIPLKDIPTALKERYQPRATPPPPDAAPPVEKPGASPKAAVENNPAAVDDKTPKTPHELVINIANKYIRQIGEDMKGVRDSQPLVITAGNAFSADKIADARQAALNSGRAMGFFILNEDLLNSPADPNKPGLTGAFAQFFLAFNKSITVVFIVLPRDQAKLPQAVAEMVKKPAPVAAPRVIITNSEISEPLYDLKLPNAQVTIEDREKLIFPGVVALKRWYVDIANAAR